MALGDSFEYLVSIFALIWIGYRSTLKVTIGMVVPLSESQWVEYYGFRRFPFDRAEAGNEEFASPEFLASGFVEPNCFGRVLGQADAPVTALLFAARGTGKTACRVMLNYYCQRGQADLTRGKEIERPTYVLCVPHFHLHQVVSVAREVALTGHRPTIHVEHHTVEILCRAVPALTELLASVPELCVGVGNLSQPDLQDLCWLVASYGRYLSSTQAQFLNELGVSHTPVVSRPIGFSTNRPDPRRQSRRVTSPIVNRDGVSPLDHVEQWARLMHKIGIVSTYVLVDGADEFEEVAANPQASYSILRPLLTCLRLMDGTPFLAFKFFLPANVEPLINGDGAFRLDRGFAIERILWRPEDLIQILRRRLYVLRRDKDRNADRLEMAFDALCVPELRGWIEDVLAERAGGNPRQLLLLCGQMVVAHCAQRFVDQDDPYQLNRADLEMALQRLGSERETIRLVTDGDVPTDVHQLIAVGENEHVEFKASIRWDFHLQQRNKNLQMIIAKTIAGMLNSEGGVLLIGIADNGTIIGIEYDLQTLTKSTNDGFLLALTDIVKTNLGIECMPYLHTRFVTVESKTVCMVIVKRSAQPVFLESAGHEFWVRTGNSTRKLDPKAAINYVRLHWGQLT